MLHIPLLRKGAPYRSLTTVRIPHYRTGKTFVEVSQANTGLIRRDLLRPESYRAALDGLTHADLIALSVKAARHFAEDTLPLGEAEQTPQDYIEQVSATTGLPFVMARKNLEKIRTALAQTEEVIAGLTRKLDLSILDGGFGEVEGQPLSFFPRTDLFGVVLPSNSPGVHSLWAPAVALKTPLVLKPGSAEPWTPYRMVQAFLRAGVPKEIFAYYPTDHAGANEILRLCGRGMFFGDAATIKGWARDPRIELHGPGYSKVVIGEDGIDHWENYLDLIVDSIVSNGGRSCVNASGVWVPRHGKEIAEALAERLAAIEPRSAEDEQAQIAPFANPKVAEVLSQWVDDGLREPGAREVTSRYREGGRLATFEGCSYVLPTVVQCDSPQHPLANCEFLFPFASVVETDEANMPGLFGHTLVVSAITENPEFIHRLATSSLIGRLNLGPIPTQQVRWDQPHEGNLFDHLYARRAFQSALAIHAQ